MALDLFGMGSWVLDKILDYICASRRGKEEKIQKVFENYAKLAFPVGPDDTGIHALMTAGACELTDSQIREVIQKIITRGKGKTLNCRLENPPTDVDLSKFLNEYRAKGKNIPCEELMKNLKGTRKPK